MSVIVEELIAKLEEHGTLKEDEALPLYAITTKDIAAFMQVAEKAQRKRSADKILAFAEEFSEEKPIPFAYSDTPLSGLGNVIKEGLIELADNIRNEE